MKITVYGASSHQMDEPYVSQTELLGELIARRGWTAVHGGGRGGVMGAGTRGAQRAGGNVTGIIPMFMVERGWLNDSLQDVVYTADMAQRKQLLAQADAMVVMPGGIGTFDEFFQAITLRQLGFNDAPIIVVNVNGFFDHMLAQLELAAACHMMRGNSRDDLFTVVDDAAAAVTAIENLLGGKSTDR